MGGGPAATTMRPSPWLSAGGTLRTLGTALWITWVAFVAFFWITRGFAGIPVAPMVGFALLLPPVRWLSGWALKRGQEQRAEVPS